MRRALKIIGWTAAAVAVAAVGAWAAATRFVEKPAYARVAVDGDFELRDYPAMALAEVATSGPRRAALGAGFRPLARYIFARDREGPKIAMTAPVMQTVAPEGAAGRDWVVGFIMPAEARLAALPAPAEAAVRLREAPPTRFAAVRFSGVASDADFDARESALRRWMAARGLDAAGPPVLAYYDDPLTPGFMRRNEVLIPVAPPTG